MARSPVVVRRALPSDAEVLAALHARLYPAHAVTGLRPRLTAALARHDVEVQLGVVDAGGGAEQVVGVLVLRLTEVVALRPGGAVHVEQLWVDPEWRRRGVARSLLAAAARTAEGLGVDDLACAVPAGSPSGREVHRFLARLGFGPAVTLRTADVGRLQRRLLGAGAGAGAAADPRRRTALDQLVARRRRQLLTGVERRAAGT